MGLRSTRDYSSVISFNPSLKCSENTSQNVKIHTKYRLFTTNDILINLVQTNVAVVVKDDEDNNNRENYDSTDCSCPWQAGQG